MVCLSVSPRRPLPREPSPIARALGVGVLAVALGGAEGHQRPQPLGHSEILLEVGRGPRHGRGWGFGGTVQGFPGGEGTAPPAAVVVGSPVWRSSAASAASWASPAAGPTRPFSIKRVVNATRHKNFGPQGSQHKRFCATGGCDNFFGGLGGRAARLFLPCFSTKQTSLYENFFKNCMKWDCCTWRTTRIYPRYSRLQKKLLRGGRGAKKHLYLVALTANILPAPPLGTPHRTPHTSNNHPLSGCQHWASGGARTGEGHWGLAALDGTHGLQDADAVLGRSPGPRQPPPPGGAAAGR